MSGENPDKARSADNRSQFCVSPSRTSPPREAGRLRIEGTSYRHARSSILVIACLVATAVFPIVAGFTSATAPSQTISLPSGGTSFGIAYDWSRGELFVLDHANCAFDTIPTSTYTATGHSFTSSLCPQEYNSSISYDGSRYVYVATTSGP